MTNQTPAMHACSQGHSLACPQGCLQCMSAGVIAAHARWDAAWQSGGAERGREVWGRGESRPRKRDGTQTIIKCYLGPRNGVCDIASAMA